MSVNWNLAHLHLLLNHFPIIGSIIGFALFIVALMRNSEELKRASLGIMAVIALLSIPAFLSGFPAGEIITQTNASAQAVIDKHAGAAMLALLFMEITGVLCLAGLWKARDVATVAQWNLTAVLLFSVITVGLMARTGNLGGEIHHPEIETPGATDSLISRMVYAVEPSPSKFGEAMVINKWRWAFIMDLHFIGLALLIGTIAILDLRMLGFVKSLPISAMNDFIPWGLAGFLINVVTGVVAFIGQPQLYAFDVAFWLKMLFIVLAGLNVVLFHVSGAFRKCEQLPPGEDTPVLARLIAGTSLCLWILVIVMGRYIQEYASTINH